MKLWKQTKSENSPMNMSTCSSRIIQKIKPRPCRLVRETTGPEYDVCRTYSRRRTQAGLGRLVYQQEQISPNNVQTSNWGPIFFSVLSLSMKHHLRRSSGICKTKWSVANSSKVGTGLIWKRAGPNGSYGGDTARKQHCVTMKERYHCRNGSICDPSNLSIQAFWQEGFLLRHSQYKLSCIVKNPSSYQLKLYLMFASNFN